MRAATVLLALLASACALTPDQRARDTVAQPAATLTATPFYPQARYQCGPAALAMVLDDAGVAVDLHALVDAVWIPGRQGTLTTELVAATRRHGRVPVRVEPRLDAVSDAVTAGYPVLVLLNLGTSWWPVWHYAVVIGVTGDTVVLRSGTQRQRDMARKAFVRHWAGADHWGVITAHPVHPPPAVTPTAWTQAAADLADTGFLRAADQALASGVRRWPGMALTHFALGNARAAAGDWVGAHTAFAQAVALRGDWVAALNNLAAAQTALGCPARALETLAHVPEPVPAVVAQTRAEARAAPHHCALAADSGADAADGFLLPQE